MNTDTIEMIACFLSILVCTVLIFLASGVEYNGWPRVIGLAIISGFAGYGAFKLFLPLVSRIF
jgi:hypothetical protein